MKVSLDNSSANTIVAYDVGMVRVHARAARDAAEPVAEMRLITSSTIITPDTLVENWRADQPHDLAVSHMQDVLEFEPEIVILGTGRQLCFPAREVIEVCHQAGAGFEVMDTGAACRTYNILAAEGRRVVAALLMIEPDSELPTH
ncbi:MAG: MTH938/NDUFAF3 family protein [Gammaproteobacteria bacterium]|jgi:uncharacterized protein